MKFKITPIDKRYLAALLVLTGVVLFWRGVWDTLYLFPIIDNPFVSLFLGLLILTVTGVIFQEFDPLSRKIAKTMELLNEIVSRKKKKENYVIYYYDEKKNETESVPRRKIKKIEHNFLVTEEKGREFFIPVHRIQEIEENGKTIWKK